MPQPCHNWISTHYHSLVYSNRTVRSICMCFGLILPNFKVLPEFKSLLLRQKKVRNIGLFSCFGVLSTQTASQRFDEALRLLRSAFVGTKLDDEIKSGVFVPATEKENLMEEKAFLADLNLPDCYFWAVHPLDSVKVEGWLRDDQQRMLDALTWSIEHVKEDANQRASRVGTL